MNKFDAFGEDRELMGRDEAQPAPAESDARGMELVNDGWQLAHDPASCGHPRACWLDRNYPESEKNYNPETRSGNPPIDMRCIMCEAETALAQQGEQIVKLTRERNEAQVAWEIADKAHDITIQKAEAQSRELAALREENNKVLDAIEHIVGDDFCEDLNMRQATLKGREKTAQEKLSAAYRLAHAFNDAHSCHHVHDDWRAARDHDIYK